MSYTVKRRSSRGRLKQGGEFRSYLYSGGFNRLEGRSTAPGSMVKPETHFLRTCCLVAFEIIFLAVGVWFMFR